MILKKINSLWSLRKTIHRQVKIYFLIVIFIGLLLLLNSISDKIPLCEKEINSPQTAQKILIVANRTYFKKRILSEIISYLKDKSYYIKISDIKYLAQQDCSPFNTIIFLVNCELCRNNQTLNKLLKTPDLAKTKKIILVRTASPKTLASGWLPQPIEQTAIDTITCASRKNKTKEIALQIIQKIPTLHEY